MSAVMTEPASPTEGTRKCVIEEVLAASFIELIEMAPANPYVRALILAQIGRMPASDCTAFEQIKEWIETTCEKKKVPPSRVRNSGGDGISITVDFSETESGNVTGQLKTGQGPGTSKPDTLRCGFHNRFVFSFKGFCLDGPAAS